MRDRLQGRNDPQDRHRTVWSHTLDELDENQFLRGRGVHKGRGAGRFSLALFVFRPVAAGEVTVFPGSPTSGLQNKGCLSEGTVP